MPGRMGAAISPEYTPAAVSRASARIRASGGRHGRDHPVVVVHDHAHGSALGQAPEQVDVPGDER